jgi:hypothetical protein
MMQWFYKIFVSEKEVFNNLPIVLPRKSKKNQLDNLINSVRKSLFFKKLKACVSIKK